MKARPQNSKTGGRPTGGDNSFNNNNNNNNSKKNPKAFADDHGLGGLSYFVEPPSLDILMDGNVLIAFRNVLKKDGTTKTRGLEELIQYAKANPFDKNGGVEESVLSIWAQLYPRVSIDDSRRVRELSHTLQYELIKSTRKRAEKYIPQTVGAWLAGLHDRDRPVARAAGEGLTSFLNTPQKMKAFWSKCQSQILEFAIAGIAETPETLSDERFTKAEDVEAKYHRVVGGSISLVSGLLEQLPPADVDKLGDRYDDFFSRPAVWQSIAVAEPAARRATCRLMMACLARDVPYARCLLARRTFLVGGLKTPSQAGSAEDFTRALICLTREEPESWSPALNKGKPLLPRLQQFIAKGSQGGSASFWEAVQELIALLPKDQLQDASVASGFLSALKSGISSREEPRSHLPSGLRCFVQTAKFFIDTLGEDSKLQLVQQQIFPLFEQYLFPAADKTSASVFAGPKLVPALVDLHIAVIRSSSPAVVSASKEEWIRLADVLYGEISNSLPEVSQEYTSSQQRIGEHGRRWFSLVAEVRKRLTEVGEVLPDQIPEPSLKIVTHSISCLQNRDMKPFGAAQVLEHALGISQDVLGSKAMQDVIDCLSMTGEGSLAKALQSASSRPLIACLQVLGRLPSHEATYAKLWNLWLEAALDVSEAPLRLAAVSSLMSHEKGPQFARSNGRLQKSIIDEFVDTVQERANSWELLKAVSASQGLTDESCKTLARSLISTLETRAELSESALQALEILVKGQQQLFSQDHDLQTALVAQLLGLSEIDDGGASSSKALAIRSLLESDTSGALPVIGIIHANLERAGPQSLNISTLLAQAQQAFDADVPLEDIFPSTNVWMQKLAPFLEQPLNPSLSITNALGGAAALSNQNARLLDLRAIARDRRGRSIPLRMALYTAELLDGKLDKSKLPVPCQVELLFIQCLILQLATDQLTSRDLNGLWLRLDEAESISEAESVVAGLRQTIQQSSLGATWWDDRAEDQASQVFRGLVKLLRQETTKLTPRGVYSARALSEILSSLVESRGLPPALEESLLKPALAKAAPETALLSAAVLSGLGETLQSSKLASNFCNRLMSDVAVAKPSEEKTFMILSLLTLSARNYDAGEIPTASNRIVFAVKQITSWLEQEEDTDTDDSSPSSSSSHGKSILSAPLSAEICRVLALLLPCMSSIFGSYWEKSITFCNDLWEKATGHPLPDALPFIHASLKLVKTLEGLADAQNDDLHDALRQSAGKMSSALLGLLRLPRGGTSQPLEIVDAMLSREVERMDVRRVRDVADVYELVASESRDIQSAAFGLLSKAIPAELERMAVENMLDKTEAKLPDELLSLLLDAPTLEKFTDEMLEQFPSPVRSYLLSWKLVFSAFAASPLKIRNDFVEHLKTEKYVGELLDFTFDVLGHSAALPLNLEKAQITADQMRDYDLTLAGAEPDERSMQWLLVHVLFLTLKYAPGLFKQWFLECRSKQTRIAVESWTARHLSPLLIADALDDVQCWGDAQEPAQADDPPMVVRVLRSTREVTASFAVDESHASIAVRLPPAFPLDAPAVCSVNRVAVRERRWQSWITIAQGAIAFSGGNVVEGLAMFKRNMVGALRGHEECAICYSVISTDRRVPDKKCGTCKNLFHRSCLYKWFLTSNQNTCPLCRTPIDYLGSDTLKRRGAAGGY